MEGGMERRRDGQSKPHFNPLLAGEKALSHSVGCQAKVWLVQIFFQSIKTVEIVKIHIKKFDLS